jgi:hypothetical protein
LVTDHAYDFCWSNIRLVTMRFFIILMIFSSLFGQKEVSISDRIIEPDIIHAYFNHLEKGVQTIQDGRQLLKGWIDLIESEYKISIDIKDIQSAAFSLLEESTLDPHLKGEIKKIFYLLSEPGDSLGISSLMCAGVSLIKNQDEPKEEYPTTMIVGGVEVFAGVLLHLIPYCSSVGKVLVGDGMRRIFNGVEEKDQEIKDKNKQDLPKMSN